MAAGGPLGRLKRSLADRGTRWARRRQGTDVLPVTLEARRIYILPTRAGAGLAGLLLAMLAAGLNYNNSLGLFLTFTLGAFGVVSLYQCHHRLLGLAVRSVEVDPVFAGEELSVRLGLARTARTDAAELEAYLRRDGAVLATAAATGDPLRPQILLRCPATERGLWRARGLGLRTRAPTGLFRSWVWLFLDVSAPVYPRPAGGLPLPDAPGEESGAQDPASGNEELVSLRPFRDGDSPRQVAWKAFARGAPLLVKEYRGLSGQRHEFDYERLGSLGPEARLSQLCQWVLEADRRGETYGLRLPGTHIAPQSGPQHRRECLTALALFGTQEERGAS